MKAAPQPPCQLKTRPWVLSAIAMFVSTVVGCGGSSSETPPPLKPIGGLSRVGTAPSATVPAEQKPREPGGDSVVESGAAAQTWGASSRRGQKKPNEAPLDAGARDRDAGTEQ